MICMKTVNILSFFLPLRPLYRAVWCIALTATFAICTLGGAQAQQQPALTFAELTQQLPTVEEGKLVEATFTFTNSSETTVVLTQVRASCGCTAVNWPREALAPGAQGTIKISYNTKNRPGYYQRSVQVYTNQSEAPIRLTLSGLVRKASQEGK